MPLVIRYYWPPVVTITVFGSGKLTADYAKELSSMLILK